MGFIEQFGQFGLALLIGFVWRIFLRYVGDNSPFYPKSFYIKGNKTTF